MSSDHSITIIVFLNFRKYMNPKSNFLHWYNWFTGNMTYVISKKSQDIVDTGEYIGFALVLVYG